MTQVEQALAILNSAAEQALLSGADRDRTRASIQILSNFISAVLKPVEKVSKDEPDEEPSNKEVAA